MKVCFIGLGSIAKRHISNLHEILGNNITIDLLRSGNGKKLSSELEPLIGNVYHSAQELPSDYDAIFITNPTKLHYQTLLEVNDKSNHFFIEKPIFDNENADLRPFAGDDKVYYVACPLRYTNVIQYLKNNIDFRKVHSIRCISSSYLPDWRPGTDYRNTYSAQTSLGGGVSIDLIHEWDYIHYLIGSPNSVKSIISQKSDLEIDSDDIAIYIADYPDKTVELHLDYFGRKTIRRIELYSEEDTIIGDLIDQKIMWLVDGKTVDLAQTRNDFQKRELEHFFEIIHGKCESDNDIEEAISILKIAKGEEKQ